MMKYKEKLKLYSQHEVRGEYLKKNDTWESCTTH